MTIPIAWALLIWIIVVISTFIISKKLYIATWESFILAILFGYVFIIIFVPFRLNFDNENLWIIGYVIVTVMSPLLLAVYIINNAIKAKVQTNSIINYSLGKK